MPQPNQPRPREQQQRGRPFVRNAANPQQVKWAARREREREEQFIGSLTVVMGTAEGRRVFGELLDRAGLYKSSYDTSGSTTYFNEGRRNFGLEVQAHLVAASEDLYEQMEREMRQLRRRLESEADAVQQASTPAADEPPSEGA